VTFEDMASLGALYLSSVSQLKEGMLQVEVLDMCVLFRFSVHATVAVQLGWCIDFE
jgi:hypothetical protein